jgi:hypothetical protein
MPACIASVAPRSLRVFTQAHRVGRAALVGALVLLLHGRAVAAPKVDTVVLDNGDRLTCEIKSLERGRLTVSTDALDTVRIYAGRVQHIVSPRQFEVERADGTRHFGTLVSLQARRLRVEAAPGVGVDLSLDDIVRIMPMEASVWQRMNGHIDLGFSFAKADLETRYTLNADAEYLGRRYEGNAVLSSQITSREDTDRLARNQLTLGANRKLGPRWSALLINQFQTNEELSLDLRTVIGGGVGRYLAQSSRTTLHLFGGMAYTHERFVGEDAQSRGEAVLGIDWDWFTVRNDHVDLSTQALSFYGVTGGSRFRLELQSAVRFEFLKDFYFSVNGYSSIDSRPPEGRSGSDAGVTLALGWSF